MQNNMAEAHKFRMKTRHNAAALIKNAQDPGTDDLKGSLQALYLDKFLKCCSKTKWVSLYDFKHLRFNNPRDKEKPRGMDHKWPV